MGKSLEDEDIIFLKYQLKPICVPVSGEKASFKNYYVLP